MKKILAMILVVLTISLFCCSCGSEEMGFGEETTKSVTLYQACSKKAPASIGGGINCG